MNEVAELWWFTEGSVCHPGDGVLLLRCLVSSSLKGMVKALPCGHLLNCSLDIFSFKLYIILEYIWINNVVIVSVGQQRDSAIHMHVSVLPKPHPHPGCRMTLSRVSRAILLVLVGYPF